MNDTTNLFQLTPDIQNRRYQPSRGVAFITHDPVMRGIFAAPFRDQVAHHFSSRCAGKSSRQGFAGVLPSKALIVRRRNDRLAGAGRGHRQVPRLMMDEPLRLQLVKYLLLIGAGLYVKNMITINGDNH